MKKLHDQIAKSVLKAVFRDMARLETNMEVRGHILEADVWVEPDPAHESDLEQLGILGRMVSLGPCLVEPFSGVPGEHDVRSCILKQYSLGHAQRRDARTRDEPEPPFPHLWIISTGSPARIIEGMGLQPMPGWPTGCFAGHPFWRLRLIVARQLPRTPMTLLMRLLSGGKTFRAAMHELARIPETAPELAPVAEQVMHVLVEFGRELNQDQMEEDDMEALRDIDAAFKEWRRQLMDELTREVKDKVTREVRDEVTREVRDEVTRKVRDEVTREVRRNAVREICQELDIELTDERLGQLAAWDADELGEVLRQLCVSHEWPGS